MRNTLQHPITTQEIKDHLATAAMRHAMSGAIGGTEGMCMIAARDIVERDRHTGVSLLDLVDQMRRSTEDVPERFISAVAALLPKADMHGLPVLSHLG